MKSTETVKDCINKAVVVAINCRSEYACNDHLGYYLAGQEPVRKFIRDKLKQNPLRKVAAELKRIINGGEGFHRTGYKQPKLSLGMYDLMTSATAEMEASPLPDQLVMMELLLKVAKEDESWTGYALCQAGVDIDELTEKVELEKAWVANRVYFCTRLEPEHPIMGREQEIQDLMHVLSRKNKCSAILTGMPGVGKTAVIQGLSRRIADKDVPDTLRSHPVWQLSVSDIQSMQTLRTEFETRLKYVLNTIHKQGDILFIDDFHEMVGAGRTFIGDQDAIGILKPFLEKGLKLVAACPDESYRKHIGRTPALTRHLTRMPVKEPEPELAKKIVKGVKKKFEKHHKLKIPAAVAEAAVELSARHNPKHALPDKALDALDRAAAKLAFEDGKILEIEHVRIQIAKMAGIDPEILEGRQGSEIIRYMKNRVFGQDTALEKLCDAVCIAGSGLHGLDSGPVGSFLLTGPTGTGKTETARALADSMGRKLIKYDMSEFSEKFSINRLIGAPPGYVGHDSARLVTDIRETPDAVLLLDEIEKADDRVLNAFLQVMDEGVLTSQRGEKADFSKTVLLMTSNLGAGRNRMGFGDSDNSSEVEDAVRQHFKPEFRNRLDAVVQFRDLKPADIARIVDKFIREMNRSQKRVRISLNTAAKDWFVKHGYVQGYGARPLKRLIREQISAAVAKEMAGGVLQDGGKVFVGAGKDGIELEYQRKS